MPDIKDAGHDFFVEENYGSGGDGDGEHDVEGFEAAEPAVVKADEGGTFWVCSVWRFRKATGDFEW